MVNVSSHGGAYLVSAKDGCQSRWLAGPNMEKEACALNWIKERLPLVTFATFSS